ncbi:MAG TPA: hypothetical protein VFO46_05385 [Candidatus Sulfotelmatobacter sp.]|nr:hypothetical protein [Candidatus Sulfotelmatobacter sp.]
MAALYSCAARCRACADSGRLVGNSYPKGNKIEPAQLGIEHEAIDGAYDVTIFEDLGNGQTKLTFIGNEPMESAKNSGQMEGWNQILDKLAAVVAELALGGRNKRFKPG